MVDGLQGKTAGHRDTAEWGCSLHGEEEVEQDGGRNQGER